MPSQAELDPILENADKKLKDFLNVLTEFKAEAAALDRQRFDADVKAIPEARELIRNDTLGMAETRAPTPAEIPTATTRM